MPLQSAYHHRTEGRWIRDLLILSTLFGFLFLYSLGQAPLIDPDEGRYAEIPREMLERGNLVTPTLNYVKYFEKPPLLYWLNAGSMKVLGQNEFAARLPSALAGLLTVLATYLVGRNLFDRRTGILAGFILGSTAGFLFQSRIILTDMVLTFCLSSALFCFLLAASRTDKLRKLLYRFFFIFCGLAVLAKGLIGIVLPAGIIFWYLLLGRRWSVLREIPWFSGIFLFALVTVPWLVLVSLENPEFPHFFFIREHFQRFTTTIHRRSQPVWFFLPILWLTMLPWSFFILGSMKKAWQDRHTTLQTSLFLMIWPIVILLFFSISSSKLIPYILPVFPPLALLVACRITAESEARRTNYTPAVFILGSLLLIMGTALAVMPLLPELPPMLHKTGQLGRELAQMLSGPDPIITFSHTIVPGGVLFCFGFLLIIAMRNRSTAMVIILLCLFGITLELLMPWAFAKYGAERLSARSLASAATHHAGPDTILAQSGPRQGMNFYTGRRLVTVGDYDELTFGSQQGDQEGWFMSDEQFRLVWQSDRHAMIVVPRHRLSAYQTDSINLKILADNGSLLLLSNK